jgi:hypothetical protein
VEPISIVSIVSTLLAKRTGIFILFIYVWSSGKTLPDHGGRELKCVGGNAICMHLTCFVWTSSWVFNNKKQTEESLFESR